MILLSVKIKGTTSANHKNKKKVNNFQVKIGTLEISQLCQFVTKHWVEKQQPPHSRIKTYFDNKWTPKSG